MANTPDASNALPLDRVSLLGLVFFGRHGAYPPERELGQRFEVDLEIACDTRPAAGRDRLEDALDYTKAYAAARDIMEGQPVNLLETLAERLADAVLAIPLARGVRVRVRKPHAPLPGAFSTVQVEVVRGDAG